MSVGGKADGQIHIGDVPAVAGRAGIGLAAQRESTARGLRPIAPKSDASRAPVVVARLAREVDRRVAREGLRPNAIVAFIALAAVSIFAQRAFRGTGRTDEQIALRVARLARDDVDHAVHCIRAPQRSARTADHLDAVDVARLNAQASAQFRRDVAPEMGALVRPSGPPARRKSGCGDRYADMVRRRSA
jgi:hypothetical protein